MSNFSYGVISDTEVEIWRDVVGYEGRYQVSNFGAIRSLPNKIRNSAIILKQSKRKDRRLVVNLTNIKNGKYKQRTWEVHQLVAAAFIGPRADGYEVCHNDGNCQNNFANNLRYGTSLDNIRDRINHDGCNQGETNGQVKLSNKTVLEIKERLSKGEKVTALAQEHKVYHGAISRIKNGNGWRHL